MVSGQQWAKNRRNEGGKWAHIDFATELQALLPNFAPENSRKQEFTPYFEPENGKKEQKNAVFMPKTCISARKND